ncbi:MAG: CDGSH iron-sulfur domain-containing protein [Candidatus Woesearchaeota archaeon]|nr:CDGSH iron-sulfur domain-containing protein [Candidatus Woesearchaeota archaeon]
MAKKIKITKDGPYLVSGNVPLSKETAMIGKEGEPETWKKGEKYPEQENYALCRCGMSKNKPYCDGTHAKQGFDGTETCDNEKYLKKAEKISGPGVDLTDAQEFCSSARFCHLSGGTWSNVEASDDPKCKKIAIQTACNCASGRLVVWDNKTNKPIEPKFEQSIGLIEDPQAGASGPIWAKGGILVESADGKQYEIRNRMTLCRCGKSGNKPFCDGMHITAKFNDGDESLKR